MYWTREISYGGIRRSDLNGQNPELIVDMKLWDILPFTMDPVEQRLYLYLNRDGYGILADEDGNNQQQHLVVQIILIMHNIIVLFKVCIA